MAIEQKRCPSWLMSAYRLSLLAYPKSFRKSYGALMEQAFADRYAELRETNSLSKIMHFSKDTLLDSSQSIWRQHWQDSQQAGFVRVRFLILLCLFMPLLIFNQHLISTITNGIYTVKNLDAEMWNAYSAESLAYETAITERLRQSSDPIARQAVGLISVTYTPGQFPQAEAIRQMNIRIAREVLHTPFQPTLFARGSNWSYGQAQAMLLLTWPIANVNQLQACRKIDEAGGFDANCVDVWNSRKQYLQFGKLMFEPNFEQPSAEQLLAAYEQNRIDELEKQYIALNMLQDCTFTDPRKNILNCNAP
jgi:hypothetical protein